MPIISQLTSIIDRRDWWRWEHVIAPMTLMDGYWWSVKMLLVRVSIYRIQTKQNAWFLRNNKNNTSESIHWWQNGTVLDNSHTGKKAPSRARESDLSLCCFCVRKSIDNLLCTAPVRANTATLYIERPVMQLYITILWHINDIWYMIVYHMSYNTHHPNSLCTGPAQAKAAKL